MRTIILIALSVLASSAQEAGKTVWRQATVSATIEGPTLSDASQSKAESFIRTGEGLSSFSLTLGKALQTGGDVTLAALFRESSVEVYLTGSRLNTLGAVVPKSVTAKQAEEGFLRSPNPLKIGHYYLVASPGLFTVLQAVDVKITDRKNGLPRKGFGENARATIELSFRYLQPQGKIESLNALLSEARDR